MSDYFIDDEELDNNYKSDYDFTSTSNFRFKKYFADKQENNFEDVDSENFGKPITITMPTDNINKLQYEFVFKDVSFNTKINQVIKNH
jgi:predicted transport protein